MRACRVRTRLRSNRRWRCIVHWAKATKTIHGVEYALERAVTIPKEKRARGESICRATSCRQRRRVRRLIYAGAQKNVGPSASQSYAIKKELIARDARTSPPSPVPHARRQPVRSYKHAATSGSTCAPHALGLESEGGCRGSKRAQPEEGGIPYDESRARRLTGARIGARRAVHHERRVAPTHSRARGTGESFRKQAQAQNMIGLERHRSVGRIRASISTPSRSAGGRDPPCLFMKDLAKERGRVRQGAQRPSDSRA